MFFKIVGQSLILNHLIATGADVNIKDKDGNTPLSLAMNWDWRDAESPCLSLVCAGADVREHLINNYKGRVSIQHVLSHLFPLKLAQTCRIVIRERLAEGVKDKIETLNLPEQIKSYLRFECF